MKMSILLYPLLILLFPLLSICQSTTQKFEYVYGFEKSYAVFRTFDKKMGVIDSTNKIVIPPVYSFIYNKKELENLFEVGNKTNKGFKRGYIDLKGTIIIPIIYDDVFYFGNGLIKVINMA